METPSEENQDQRQDKRGTNEHSQRASSVPFTAVFTGALTYSSLLGFTPHSTLLDPAPQHPRSTVCMNVIADIPAAVCASVLFFLSLSSGALFVLCFCDQISFFFRAAPLSPAAGGDAASPPVIVVPGQ